LVFLARTKREEGLKRCITSVDRKPRTAVAKKDDPDEGNRSRSIFPVHRILGMLPLASCNSPLGALRNRYKYLMALIERLFFSTGREWRKFLAIIDVRDW
jgi:hypothetical protein